MTLRLSDLSADVRKRVQAGDIPKAKATRAPAVAGIPLVCHTCGQLIAKPSESSLGRHSGTHGGLVRYEMEVGR